MGALRYILHYGSDKTDWTRKNWFVAVGYLVTQLLRHGKRGAYDQDPNLWVYGSVKIQYYPHGMLVSDIVQQPNLRIMNAAVGDVVRYAWRLMHADIPPDKKRIEVERVGGIWYARAYQGHSKAMKAILGPRSF